MTGLNDNTIADLIRSVGPETARDLYSFFLEESRDRLHRMEDQLATDALVDLAREAHSLKSAAATYGADDLAELARAVELACGDGNLNSIAEHFRILADQSGASLDRLETRVGELTA